MRFPLMPFKAACISTALLVCPAYVQVAAQDLTDAQIRSILQDRVDQAKSNVGIVVGLVDAKGTRIIAYGKPSLDSTAEVNGDTVFEIGSITKLFTDTLLADMVEKGEVDLNDPISQYLPPSVKAPTFNGHEITLLSLANHVSGLPRIPDNMQSKDAQNPYADYSIDQLYAFLSNHQLKYDVGLHYQYSNLGVGLLGHLLTLKAQGTYEDLVRTRICEPLGMEDTRITLTPSMKARLAQGHNELGVPTSNWDLPTLAGAGALRSTAKDLLKFLAANLCLAKTPLAPAMERAQGSTQGLNTIRIGWRVNAKGANLIFSHAGGTGGYNSFVCFDRQRMRGVVVLTNSVTQNGVDDIGLHLLDSASYRLIGSGTETSTKAIQMNPALLDAYAGTYQVAPNYLLVFSREGGKFFAQIGDTPKFEIFAKSETDFFRDGVHVTASFAKDAKGVVSRVILRSNQGEQTATRIQ
jgi:serine-type D-Ala-D-Ala carboxypeptidase/endopeptidase